ncbi:MAG: ABC transporter ATP-binding protein [bacterium]
MIVWRGVTVRYRGRVVLDQVSLEVPSGQRVALVGPNGAGKTTLLRTLVGLVPYEGGVEVDGLDARLQPVEARGRIGYVPQLLSFPQHLTAAEVLALAQELRGTLPDPAPLLREAGLTEHARKPVRELSGGMLRRLGVAVAQVGDPPVLVLDEPTSYLDREGEAWLVRWLRAAAGKTVVVASHQLRGLDRLVDRVVVLDGGRLVRDLMVDQLRALHWLEVVVPPPEPRALPEDVRVLARRNGAVHLQVPDHRLREVLGALEGRPVEVHEPPVEDLLREVLG